MALLEEMVINECLKSQSEIAISTEEIERKLGFDKIEPIRGLTPSVLKELENDNEYFKEMYEECLRAYYSGNNRD